MPDLTGEESSAILFETHSTTPETDPMLMEIMLEGIIRWLTETPYPNLRHGMTTFPQTWLGTLLYSCAINGNGHDIIWRKGHVWEQYDQGGTMYVSLCLHGRRTGIPPRSSYHGTVL
jgi:hypothetical protein